MWMNRRETNPKLIILINLNVLQNPTSNLFISAGREIFGNDHEGLFPRVKRPLLAGFPE
jgi:hypothetical protein